MNRRSFIKWLSAIPFLSLIPKKAKSDFVHIVYNDDKSKIKSMEVLEQYWGEGLCPNEIANRAGDNKWTFVVIYYDEEGNETARYNDSCKVKSLNTKVAKSEEGSTLWTRAEV